MKEENDFLLHTYRTSNELNSYWSAHTNCTDSLSCTLSFLAARATNWKIGLVRNPILLKVLIIEGMCSNHFKQRLKKLDDENCLKFLVPNGRKTQTATARISFMPLAIVKYIKHYINCDPTTMRSSGLYHMMMNQYKWLYIIDYNEHQWNQF